jgi:hypothetical protein
MNEEASPVEGQPARVAQCVHLRAKTMYIPALSSADAPPAPFYWCNRTLRELGPDGESVHVFPCGDQERGCYRSSSGG